MNEIAFEKATAVWPKDLADVMNVTIVFTAEINLSENQKIVLRLAGAMAYRICVNGVFAGYGPARAPKGFARIEEWPLAVGVREGRNIVTIEVVSYRCVGYYFMNTPSFLRAEIVAEDGSVLASTPNGFRATLAPRVQKVSRYSFQRGFSEIWHFRGAASSAPYADLESDESASIAELELVESDYGEGVTLLPRRVPLPDCSVGEPFTALRKIEHSIDESAKDLSPFWFWKEEAVPFYCYAASEVEEDTTKECSCVRCHSIQEMADGEDASSAELIPSQGILFDGGVNDTGFIQLKLLITEAPARIVASFDEVVGDDGTINFARYSCTNCVVWEFSKPGEYVVESFEPYTYRYLDVFPTKGKVVVRQVALRGYRCPMSMHEKPSFDEPALDQIYEAARLTFATNAVDVFTDCPGRERAGWLCDSYFTARASWLFTGSLAHEDLFLENYAVPKCFESLPDGMLPMCWPSDPRGAFIPNWAMWFVLQLEEYAFIRGGSRKMVDSLRDRIFALLRYFEPFENEDGLLESLPGWNFVEWSMANDLTDGVNYPTNMTYASVLDAVAHLYDREEFKQKAEKIREVIRRQSFDGRWFRDHAVREGNGKLMVCDDRTETCQYYAFYFATATKELHPELWRALSEEFGPKRTETGRYPDIYPSNAFIGNFLRMELILREGNRKQILDEMCGYFQYMAERTGTLWENVGAYASCCHGFASYVAVVLEQLERGASF